MSRELPAIVRPISRALVETAGGFLHNTIREAGVTCDVCSAPVGAGYQRCQPCNNMAAVPASAKADRVAPVIYAPYVTQSYTMMRGYKAPIPGPSHTLTIQLILGLALHGHIECVIKLGAGMPVRWAVVSSIPARESEHPLHAIVASLAKHPQDEVVLTATPGISAPRTYGRDHYVVEGTVSGHVLLIDDSWTTGSHAQSAAAALKKAGASVVSILVVARLLNPAWGPNGDFIKARLKNDFNPEICPWTAGECP